MNRSLLVGMLAAAVAGLGTYWWLGKNNATENPGDGAAMVEITIPQLSGVNLEGQQLFLDNCASCHGENAVGKEGAGPPLVHIIYEPNHHGDMSFQLAAKRGVRAHHWKFGNMPPVEDVSEQQVEKIIAFVRTLQRANGIN